MELSASNGSGDGEFDLESISLRSFSVKASSGDIAADAGGGNPFSRSSPSVLVAATSGWS